MHVCFYIGLFVAFVVLPLLSFLRNGAVLRGGAVSATHGERKGEEDASVIALQDAKRPPLLRVVNPLTELESPELQSTQGDSGGVSLAEALSPHSQSSRVFLQARRSALLRRRNVKLIQQRGGDAAEVAAAEREGVTASTGSDVASAWDPKQLGADDSIRLVFLFTFALPLFVSTCWKLRGVRPPYLLRLYCYLRGASKDGTNPQLQAALCAGPVVALLGAWLLVFLYYAFFVYLDHRDKDVGLKRHNDTRWNRLVNWCKFRLYRRYVNCQCYLWKRYFSLQLVPAYGPLPLFLFPDGQEEPFLSHENSNSKTDAARSSSGGEGGAAGTPSHHFAAATASARHNPFFVAVRSSTNNTGENTPLDMPPLLPSSSSIVAPVLPTACTAANVNGRHGGLPGKKQKAFLSSKATEEENEEVSGGDDWDAEERGLLRRRSDADGAGPTQPPPADDLTGLADADAVPTRGPSESFSSAELTKALSAPPSPPPPPPPMRRAQYFFAAHPHGIIPWCCCVNLISNVTQRNAKLFVDNREAVVHPACADTGASTSSQEMSSIALTSASSGVSSPTCVRLRTANTFTTSDARATATRPSPTESRQRNANSASPRNASNSTTTSYAKGRYYVYDVVSKRFVLRLDKDEAVPASAADAVVYQQRLQAAEEKDATKQRAPGAGGAASSRRRRLTIRIRAVVATFPFYVPIMREIYMFYGYMDASYETCKRVLLYNNSTRREREGMACAPPTHAHGDSGGEEGEDDDDDESTLPDDLNHLMLFPGGASEALLSSSHGPARVLLRRRKGFLRLVLHTRSGLVPVYTFGETDYFDQFSTATTRYAAPLDDDSTFFSHEESAPQAAGSTSMPAATHNGTDSVPPQPHRSTSASHHGNVVSSRTDAEDVANSSDHRSPPSTRHDAFPLSPTPSPTPTSAQRETQQSRMRTLERRLLRDEEDARDREGRLPRSPAPPLPAELQRSKEQPTGASPTTAAVPSTPSTPPSPPPSAAAHESATRSSPAAGRVPRLIQVVQRLFQETFGISLPVVRNIIPHRVTGATVVGRPIYFELPPDLQRMYTDPANYYDRDKERAVLIAAQEVYFNELQDLFLKYAPRYLKDPSRRKLEIL